MTRLHFLPHSTVQSILRWPTRSHVLAKFPRQMDHRSRVAALGQAVVACSRVALMILIVGLLGIPSLTVAQSSVTMNPTSGLAGTRVDATGSGFTPSSVDLDAEVFVFWDLNFEGSFLAEATINSLGNFAVSFNVPQDATVGEHQITFLDEETPTNDQTLTFTVTAPPTPPPKLLGISEGAGRIWITGHDPDLHCFDTSAGDQCNYFGQAVNFVVNDSTLPVLALDHGAQIAAATSNALGASAPAVVTCNGAII